MAITGHFFRALGVPTNTNFFTILFAVKRTADDGNKRTVLTVRDATQSTGHDLVMYDTSAGVTPRPLLLANYAANISAPLSTMPLNTWRWYAISGINGSTMSIKEYNGTAFVTVSVAQTAFNIGLVRFATDTVLANFSAKYAHIREWNSVLSDAQLIAEIQSSTPVLTTNLVSAKSGIGTVPTTVLLGQTGTTFSSTGTIVVDSDEPVFLSNDYIYLSGDVLAPSRFAFAPQALASFSQSAAVVAVDAPAPTPETLFASANQTFTINMTSTIEAIPIVGPPLVLDPPVLAIGATGVSPVQVVGTGRPGATITIYLDGAAQADSITVDFDGVWSTVLDLAEGTYQIRATQTFETLTSASTPTTSFTIIAVGGAGNRFRSGSGTGPRKAFRSYKTSKNTSWPTK